jgi:hypothetical protein
MGGKEICAKCGFPTSRGRTPSLGIGRLFKKYKARKTSAPKDRRHFFSKPVGAGIVLTAVLLSSVLPNLPVLDRRSFIALANSNLPNGNPRGSFGELAAEPVFQSIIQNGGQIVLTSKLDDSNSRYGDAGLGQVAGNWDPNTGTMKLRVGDFTYEQYLAILNHEAIHMAQSCKANSIKANPAPIGLQITQEGVARLEPYRATNPSYYQSRIEREAYSNDHLDSRTIARIINEQCGSKPWIPFLGNLRSTLQAAYLR